MRIYLLSKRHRGSSSCDLCQKYRFCARLPLVDHNNGANRLLETFDICGPCGREINRIATEGRKREL